MLVVFRGIPEKAAMPVALTIGNFDGVHLGHRAVLSRLKEKADSLCLPACVLTFEPHPREFFDPKNAPARLTSLEEKIGLLAEAGIDRVHVCRFDKKFSEIHAHEFISRLIHTGLDAKWVLIGDDFRFGSKRMGDFDVMKKAGKGLGFDVEAIGSIMHEGKRISSTFVRETLKSGDLSLAKQLLDRNYSIKGRVIHGEKLGKKMGFPTANIKLKHNKPPLTGIYVVKVGKMEGVASLGVRPTIEEEGKPVLEVHLFDFESNIYGKKLNVEFLLKLRDEEKYPDIDTLTQHIAIDVANARHYFSEHKNDRL